MWDRIADLHLAEPLQKIVDARLFMPPEVEPGLAAYARGQLDRVYAALDRRMAGRDWLGAARFTLADCAAAPALFYAATLHPLDPYPALAAYLDRLAARPSFARVLDEARPWFHLYPLPIASRAGSAEPLGLSHPRR